jgi:ABC-2 type transport system ATP-binding protein
MIEVEALSTWYGSHQALVDVSFTATPGSVTGLLGPNGAGKSSLLRTIAGCMPGFEGVVRIAGLSLADSPREAKTAIGYLPERAPLYDEFTVHEQLRITALLRGVPRHTVAAEISRVSELCGLSECASTLNAQLSQGYRQRVGLAQAVIGDPPVLLLDEPTAALDPGQIAETRELIRSLSLDHTVLLSTHVLPDVESICGNVLVLNRGEVVADGSLEALQGGSVRVEIRLTAAASDSTIKSISAYGDLESVDDEGKRMSLRLREGASPADLYDWSVSHNLRLSALVPMSDSLESRFAEIVAENR